MTRFANGPRRTTGFLQESLEQGLTCPRGHHIGDSWLVLSEHLMRCQHRAERGANVCNALIWVTTQSGIPFIAEVDFDDVRVIKTHRSVQETLAYLGASLWPRRRKTTGEAA